MQLYYNNITHQYVFYVVGYYEDSWVSFNITLNNTLNGWQKFSTDTSYPWSWNFTFPNGFGYYEFYSIGKKAGSSDEEAPAIRDALCRHVNGSSPPDEPHDPFPPDGATDIDITTHLNWSGGDPDAGDTVTYDVYFGTSSSPPKLVSNQTNNSYQPASLNSNTTYYWKIVSWDNHGVSTAGPLWSFTTKPLIDVNPPYIIITKPIAGYFYMNDKILLKRIFFKTPFIIKSITIEVEAIDNESGVQKVEFYINDTQQKIDDDAPYNFLWEKKSYTMQKQTITVVVYDIAGNQNRKKIDVVKIL
jgi:hypothetical protein